MGFINGNHLQASDQAQRSEIIIEQFEQIFPGARQHLLHYDDYLWYDDPLCQSPAPREHPLSIDPQRQRLFISAAI